MFSEGHDDLIAFRNGDFFTKDYAMVKGKFYDNHTGEEIEPNEELEELKARVEHELMLSDKVLQGDLLRFYTPTENWEPVDTSEYFYDDKQIEFDPALIEKWLKRMKKKIMRRSIEFNRSKAVLNTRKKCNEMIISLHFYFKLYLYLRDVGYSGILSISKLPPLTITTTMSRFNRIIMCKKSC